MNEKQIGEFQITDIKELYNAEGGKIHFYSPINEYFQLCVFSDQKRVGSWGYTPIVNISQECYNKILNNNPGASDILIYKFFRLRNSTELEPGNLKAGISKIYDVYYQFIYYKNDDIDENTQIDIESICEENIFVLYLPTMSSSLKTSFLTVAKQNYLINPDFEDLKKYDIFNPNSDFYTSVCALYTYNTYLESFIKKESSLKYYDLSLEMRKKYFPGPLELCPITCEYIGMKIIEDEQLLVVCKCDDQHFDLIHGAVPQYQTFSSIYYDENKFNKSYKDNYFSIETFKCFEITIKFGFQNNYGSYIVLGIGILISLAFGGFFLWGKGRITSIFEILYNNNINSLDYFKNQYENNYNNSNENIQIYSNNNKENNNININPKNKNNDLISNVSSKKEFNYLNNQIDNNPNENKIEIKNNEENEKEDYEEEEEEDDELQSASNPPKKIIIKKKKIIKKNKKNNIENQENQRNEEPPIELYKNYQNEEQDYEYYQNEKHYNEEYNNIQESKGRFYTQKQLEEQKNRNIISKHQKNIEQHSKLKPKKELTENYETEETNNESNNYIPDIGRNQIVIPIDNIFTDQELNMMDLEGIYQYDRRSFMDVYFSILNTKSPIFFIFSYYNSNKGISLSLQIKYPEIKLIFFCIIIYICFFFNATVFGSKSITYRINGTYDFGKHITFGVILAPFCLILKSIIHFLIFFKVTKKITDIKIKLFTSLLIYKGGETIDNFNSIFEEEEEKTHKVHNTNNFDGENGFNEEDITKKDIKEERLKLKNQIMELFYFIKIRTFITIGCMVIIIIFMWYYIAAFCVCYRNTQVAFLLNTLLTFIFCNIISCCYCFIPSFFRKLAVDKQDNRYFICYQILQVI